MHTLYMNCLISNITDIVTKKYFAFFGLVIGINENKCWDPQKVCHLFMI